MVSFVITLIGIELLLSTHIFSTPEIERLKYETEGSGANILLLGDSFLGKKMDIEKHLVSEFKKQNLTLLNLGNSGDSPLDYLMDYNKFGNKKNSEVVILGYYVGNDLSMTKEKIPSAFEMFLKSRYLWRLLLTSLDSSKLEIHEKAWRKAGIPEYVIEKVEQGIASPLYLEVGMHYKSFLEDNLLMEGSLNEKRWENNKKLLLRIKNAVEENGGTFALVLFPHTLQVSKRQVQYWRDIGLSVPDKLIGSSVPQNKFKVFCNEKEIRCLDFLPLFRERKLESLYKNFDDHFNEKGNSLITENIIKLILSL